MYSCQRRKKPITPYLSLHSWSHSRKDEELAAILDPFRQQWAFLGCRFHGHGPECHRELTGSPLNLFGRIYRDVSFSVRSPPSKLFALLSSGIRRYLMMLCFSMTAFSDDGNGMREGTNLSGQ